MVLLITKLLAIEEVQSSFLSYQHHHHHHHHHHYHHYHYQHYRLVNLRHPKNYVENSINSHCPAVK